MPPRVRSPKLVQGVQFAFFRRSAMRRWIERHGRIFEIDVPIFGRSVVVSDPALTRSVCTAGADELVDVQPNLGNWFGPGSVFGLDGSKHRNRRRVLAAPFHGRHIERYDRIVEDETLRETANWPEGIQFRTLESMNRITLGVILRVMFGRADVEELRQIIPRYMRLGQILAFAPVPPAWINDVSPRGRLDSLRRAFDRRVAALIDDALADPALGERTDVLACLLRGGEVPREEICDELMTLVCAGHETTGAAMAWTFERLRRHPDVLDTLMSEVDRGGGEYRRATILESLRSRTVIDVFGRRVRSSDFVLGDWAIPVDTTVLVRIADLHHNPAVHTAPERFDPGRFVGARPAAPLWLPFGGGSRRCIGADFAIAEMDVVLRTVLRQFRVETDAAPDEKSLFRGIAHVPKRGGSVVVSRRRSPLCPLE